MLAVTLLDMTVSSPSTQKNKRNLLFTGKLCILYRWQDMLYKWPIIALGCLYLSFPSSGNTQTYPIRQVSVLELVDIVLDPAVLRNGMMWRKGNNIFYRMNGRTDQYTYGPTPLNGQTWVHNFGIWSPDSIIGGAGGGSTAWHNIAAPGADKTFSFGTYATTFSFGATIGAGHSYTVTSLNSPANGYLFRVYTDGVTDQKPFGVFTSGTSNGVEMGDDGYFKVAGTGQISATKWKGLDTVARTNLPIQVVYEDERNAFTKTNWIIADSANGPVFFVKNNNAAGYGERIDVTSSNPALLTVNAGSGASGYFSNSSTGYAIHSTTSGANIQRWVSAAVIRADATSTGIVPFVSGGWNLGTFSYHFGDLYSDSLFIGTADIKKTWRGDGTLPYALHFERAYAANDSIIVTGIPTGKTWSFSSGVVNKPPTAFTPGFLVRNDTLYVSSSHTSMFGIIITVNMFEQNF
jgi:hypothetical protein